MKSIFKHISISKKHRILFVIIILVGLAGAALLFRTAERLGQHDHAADEHSHQTEDTHAHAAEPAAANDTAGRADKTGADDHDENLIRLSDAQLSSAGITLETAGPAKIANGLLLTGEIQLNQDSTAHIVPRLSGVVESVHATLGQKVAKGQLLAVIASTAASELRSELQTAQQRLKLAQTTHEREQALWQQKISAEQDYLQARQLWQEAQLNLANVKQKLAALGLHQDAGNRLNRYELRAPFAGSVIEKHLVLGETVKEDIAAFTISDLSQVWAEINIPAGSLATITNGSEALIRSASFAAETRGRISLIGNLIGEQTRSAKARIVIPNPQGIWRPGLFISAELESPGGEAQLSVLNQAIQTVDQRQMVFVRVAGGFAAQPIKTGRSDGQRTEILSGLSSGAAYAVNGSFIIKSELGKAAAEHSH